jgi:hypothetical protein
VSTLRNQFSDPSKVIISTVLIALNQVKDGFWQTMSNQEGREGYATGLEGLGFRLAIPW